MKYGLTTAVQADLTKENGQILGRIIGQHRDWYQVITTAGERSAQVTGKLAYEAASPAAFPAVGDWVCLSSSADNQAQIEAIAPRQSVLARGAVNRQDGQIIATNINTIFICMSLNADFNVRRLERYLTIAWDSGALPVIVLTKADLCTDLATKLRAAVEVGTVTSERLQSYQKLQREMSYQGLNSRQLEQAKIQRMFGGKQAMKRVKQRYHRD
ncbi:GTPase RsgA [Lactiplantibacillus plantarum]|uniref:GTPase RsgA n=1 Tax=Lactiplantibacillus plantarum TaxID=1590 RepID=UPI003F737076